MIILILVHDLFITFYVQGKVMKMHSEFILFIFDEETDDGFSEICPSKIFGTFLLVFL